MIGQAAHHGAHAACVIKVFHQIGVAAGTDIGNHRYLAAGGVEVVQAHGAMLTRAAGHRHQMNDGVGRAAHGHGNDDGIFKRSAVKYFGRRQVFPHHFNCAPTTISRHADVVCIHRRNRRGARQGHAYGFSNACHGAGGSHGHAVAMAAGNAAFYFQPLGLVDLASAALVPILPGVRARTQHLALDIAAQHRACRHVDAGEAGTHRAHQQAGRGLVATAHQYHAVHRVAAQQFFNVHGQQVAVKHGRGLDHRFRQGKCREFQRKTARLQHTTLDIFNTLLEVAMTGADVAPGVKDGNHRFAFPVLRAVAQLHDARAVAKRAHVVRGKPARAAQVLVGFFCHAEMGF